MSCRQPGPIDIATKSSAGAYRATPQEIAGIERGLRDAAADTFATEEEIEAVFARHRLS